MNQLVPNYYHLFKCIADKCRHNCCIGWEIDIDSDTAEYYKGLQAPIGEKIRSNIDFDCDCPHFVLKADDRCPFLQDDGLCEIIKNLGEQALCDICTDHPRFRNFYENFEEMGIGLCCEEAARVILSFNEKFSLVPLYESFLLDLTDDEKVMLEKREAVFNIILDRRFDIRKRIDKIASLYDFTVKEVYPHSLKELFLSLERLDDGWTTLLESIVACDDYPQILSNERYTVAFEQLLCYFVFRHFADGINDGLFCARIKLCVAATLLIASLCDLHEKTHGNVTLEDLAEISRMFSSEVEYSQENLDTIFESI